VIEASEVAAAPVETPDVVDVEVVETAPGDDAAATEGAPAKPKKRGAAKKAAGAAKKAARPRPAKAAAPKKRARKAAE
jgi:hypothetical protein